MDQYGKQYGEYGAVSGYDGEFGHDGDNKCDGDDGLTCGGDGNATGNTDIME
jgi:hypothetical protein